MVSKRYYNNKDHQRVMVDATLMIVQNSRVFLSDITPSELAIYVIQTFIEAANWLISLSIHISEYFSLMWNKNIYQMRVKTF